MMKYTPYLEVFLHTLVNEKNLIKWTDEEGIKTLNAVLNQCINSERNLIINELKQCNIIDLSNYKCTTPLEKFDVIPIYTWIGECLMHSNDESKKLIATSRLNNDHLVALGLIPIN